jgi:protein translocase SecG subunit
MLKVIGAFLSIFLIVIIFLRIPQESVGLASFSNTSNLLGSPRSAQRFLNVLTAVCILLYFGIAFQLNLVDR